MTLKTVRIADLARHVGEQVKVQGWLYDKTGKGKLAFLQVRDGTGICQCVAFKPDLGDEVFRRAETLPQESSLQIVGTVREDRRAPGVPGGFEIAIQELTIVSEAEEYPIGPKEHGIDFLMNNRHLWVRSKRQWAILRIRSTIINTIRSWLDDHEYLLVDTPIISPAAGESTTELFPIEYFEDQAFLAQTGQLYNEANMMAFGKVYCFGPTFRAERAKTRRHLAEFWMVEPEMAWTSLEALMDMEQDFISAIVQRVLEKHRVELDILERDTAHLERVLPPFPRISYDEAVERLNKLAEGIADPERQREVKIEWGNDFGSPHETELTKQFDRPVFVYHYPTQVKAFYMQPVGERPEVCRSVDLLAPEGYGEITGGSERIYDKTLLEQRIRTIGLDPKNYQWYLDLRRFGSVPHAGFGLGVERTVAWICKLDHIREAVPYARTYTRLYP